MRVASGSSRGGRMKRIMGCLVVLAVGAVPAFVLAGCASTPTAEKQPPIRDASHSRIRIVMELDRAVIDFDWPMRTEVGASVTIDICKLF